MCTTQLCRNYIPFTRDDTRSLVAIRRAELIAAQDLLDVVILPRSGNDGRDAGAVEGVTISGAKFSQENLHRRGSLEREPRKSAIGRKFSWQGTKEEATKHASVSWTFRVTHAIRVTPRGEVEGGEIRREVAVATRQGNGIAENSTAYSVSYEEGIVSQPKDKRRLLNAPGQRPAPSTTGLAFSACKPT